MRACPATGLTAACPQVPEIVSVLRSKLQETREEHVLQAAQHSVFALATHHCAAVVSNLLGSPLPFDRYLVPTHLQGWMGLRALVSPRLTKYLWAPKSCVWELRGPGTG